MRGRHPDPPHLKLVEGNPGHRPIGGGPAGPPGGPGHRKADTERPTCPKELCSAAKKEWRRLVPILEEMGLLGRTDRAHIAAYCTAWARFIEAELEIQRVGSIIKSKDGGLIENPYNWISKREREIMARFGDAMCLPALARVRAGIHMVPKGKATLRERLAQ